MRASRFLSGRRVRLPRLVTAPFRNLGDHLNSNCLPHLSRGHSLPLRAKAKPPPFDRRLLPTLLGRRDPIAAAFHVADSMSESKIAQVLRSSPPDGHDVINSHTSRVGAGRWHFIKRLGAESTHPAITCAQRRYNRLEVDGWAPRVTRHGESARGT